MKRVAGGLAGLAVTVALGGMAGAQTAETPAPNAPPPPPKTWADSVTLKGDIRYRYEAINDDSKLNSDKDQYTRERNRYRVRLGAEAKCNDRLKAGLEFSTGGADPVSGNQTLGDGFGKEDFRLNLGYAEYSLLNPDLAHELKLTGGKMKNPFINVADLVWDGDATPEGIAARGVWRSDSLEAFGNAGSLWVQERSADRDDTVLYAGQGALRFKLAPEFSLLAGVSLYQYDEMQGYDVADWEGRNNGYGNSTVNGTVSGSTTNKAWKYAFEVIEYFAAVETWLAGRPLTFVGQALSNADPDDYEAGYQYGVSYGKAKNPRTFELAYWFAELEKDAVPGFLTDSDRWGGGTDGRGHKFAAKYQLMKNLQAGVTYFLGERKISDSKATTDYDRLQVDFVAAF